MHVLTSLSFDEILLPNHDTLSTIFKGLPFNVEKASFVILELYVIFNSVTIKKFTTFIFIAFILLFGRRCIIFQIAFRYKYSLFPSYGLNSASTALLQ